MSFGSGGSYSIEIDPEIIAESNRRLVINKALEDAGLPLVSDAERRAAEWHVTLYKRQKLLIPIAIVAFSAGMLIGLLVGFLID